MAYKLATLSRVTVSTAGTRVQLTANEGIAAASILISADTGNIGKVYIGDVTVDDQNGDALEPGDSLEIAADSLNGRNQEIFLSSIYADADTNGNAVTVQYLKLK